METFCQNYRTFCWLLLFCSAILSLSLPVKHFSILSVLTNFLSIPPIFSFRLSLSFPSHLPSSPFSSALSHSHLQSDQTAWSSFVHELIGEIAEYGKFTYNLRIQSSASSSGTSNNGRPSSVADSLVYEVFNNVSSSSSPFFQFCLFNFTC